MWPVCSSLPYIIDNIWNDIEKTQEVMILYVFIGIRLSSHYVFGGQQEIVFLSGQFKKNILKATKYFSLIYVML